MSVMNAIAAIFPIDFGKVSSIVLLLILVQAAIIVIALAVFLILLVRKRVRAKQRRSLFISPSEAAAERRLVGITVDSSAVQREFTAGEVFNSDGLIVTANYSTEPLSERIDEYTVEEPDMSRAGSPTVTVSYGGFTAFYTIEIAENEVARTPIGMELDLAAVRREFAPGEPFDHSGLAVRLLFAREPYLEDVYDFTVEAPDMSETGEKMVAVRYGDFVEFYQINVVVPELAEEAATAEDAGDEYERVLHVDKSFTAKLIQSDGDTQRYYSAIKNELLNYKKVHDRMSWKRETYKVSGSYVAKISFRGSTLCLFLPLDPAAFAETKYKVEDASSYKSSEDTPCLFRIKNEKRMRLACELIAQVMEERGVVRKEREPVDYTMPEQPVEELVEQGLVRYEYRLRKKGAGFIRDE